MEPVSLATIGTVLAATKGSVDIATSAYRFISDLKASAEETGELIDRLLRGALLALDRNLVVLDAVNMSASSDLNGELLAVANTLDLAPIAALLVQGPIPTNLPCLGPFSGEKEFEEWTAKMDIEEKGDVQILAHARFIVARAEGMRGLYSVASSVRKPMRVGLRLKNLKDSHLTLRKLLSDNDAVSPLKARRSTVSDRRK